MFRNRPNSARDPRSKPSAMFETTDRLARRSWLINTLSEENGLLRVVFHILPASHLASWKIRKSSNIFAPLATVTRFLPYTLHLQHYTLFIQR
jgi:glutamine synthetase adenylyltransferase